MKQFAESARNNAGKSAGGGRALVVALVLVGFLFAWRGYAQRPKSMAKAETAQEKGVSSKAAPAPDAARGKKLFTSDGCYECHGHRGQGSVMSGPRLAPDPVPYSDFVGELRHPVNQMPPYTSKVVPDRDARDIYAFLQSIPKPPKAASIPELR